MNTEISQKMLQERWPTHSNKVFTRLCQGMHTYGDASFQSSPVELIEQKQQELLDVNGWSFILWCVLEDIKEAIAQMDLGRAEREKAVEANRLGANLAVGGPTRETERPPL